MATYQAKPHPTDGSGRHDDRYMTDAEIEAELDLKAVKGDTALTLAEAIDGFNTGIEGRARITIDTEAPVDPNHGDIWIDNTSGYIAFAWDAVLEDWAEIVNGVAQEEIDATNAVVATHTSTLDTHTTTLDTHTTQISFTNPGVAGGERQSPKVIDGDVVWSDFPEIYARDLGAVGDNSTDDTVAVKAALTELSASGGGILRFDRSGSIYLLNTPVTTTPSGQMFILPIDFNNCLIKVDAGVTVRSTYGHANQPVLFDTKGSYKGAGNYNDWGDHWFGKRNLAGYPVYEMEPVAKGDTSITLSTPAEAANVAVGDIIYLSTGQTVSGSTTEPDAEYNFATGVDIPTGVIDLLWPASKPYLKEYYISGTTGVTSTSVTANPAPCGLQVVTDATIQNFRIEGPGKIDYHPSSDKGSMLGGHQVIGLELYDLEIDLGNVQLQNQGLFRNASFEALHASINGSAGRVFLTTSTGVNNFDVKDCIFNSYGDMSFVHLAEGSAGFRMFNSRIWQRPVVNANALVTAASRGYDHEFHDVELVRVGGQTMSYSGTQPIDGLVLDNVRHIGASTSISAKNIQVISPGKEPPLPGYFDTYGAIESVIFPIHRWVYWNSIATLPFKSLPPRYVLHDAFVLVAIAFDGTGPTPSMTLGISTSTSRFLSSIDLSTTGKKGSVTGTNNTLGGAAVRDAEIYFTAAGSGATVGAALVTMMVSIGPVGTGV